MKKDRGWRLEVGGSRINYFFLIFFLSSIFQPPSSIFSQEEAGSPAHRQALSAYEVKTEDKIFQDLERVQKFYEQASAHFQEGKYKAAQRSLKKSFQILSSLITEEGIAEKIRPELESMMEKIHAAEAEAPPVAPDAPSSLDIPPEELSGTVSTDAVSVPDTSRYLIPVDPADKLVRQYIVTYAGTRRDKVLGALERSGRFREMIQAALREAGLPRELFYLVMVESEYKVNAYSRAGAAGLWQLMPATGRKLGLKVNYWVDERFDPELATRSALKYLKNLYEHFDDWHLALAAYNRGEFGIERDLRFAKATDFERLTNQGVTPRETEHFVPKFMACALIGDNPQQYGFRPQYEEPDSYDVVEIEKPLDLIIAAKCAGTNEDAIRRLNPAVRGWCTPINYPDFKLKIPKGTRELFLQELAQVKDWNPNQGVVRHKIRSGDVLSRLAKQYRTTVRAIMETNRIANPKLLRPGQVLNIQPGLNLGKAGRRKKR